MRFKSLIFSALFPLSFYSGDAWSSCGKFMVVKGDVKIELAKGRQTEVARVGSEICSGDTVKAGAESRAKIVMIDSNELNISPDSKITLENYDFKPDEGKKKVMLNVLYGKVRSTVKQHYDDKSKDGQANTFQVKTKAAVAGVRGTDFLIGYSLATGRAEVTTFSGRVEVGQFGAGGAIKNSVFVAAGQKTEASPNQVPATPHTVPAAELKKLNSDTKAETATTGGSAGKEKPSDAKKTDEKKNDDAKSDSGKSESANSKSESGSMDQGPAASNGASASASASASNGDSSARGPASGGAGSASGAMLDSRDLPTSPSAMPDLKSGPTLPPIPIVQAPVVVVMPTQPDFVKQIPKGPSQVTIVIHTP